MKHKVIYVGLQRCGTKTFSRFFAKNGYRSFTWAHTAQTDLLNLVQQGRWVEILNSGIFNQFDVFDDYPFYLPEFSRFLVNYIPNCKVVFMTRPPQDWFKSMLVHSKGLTLGEIEEHCYRYDRLGELDFLRRYGVEDVHKLNMIGMKNHYCRMYELHSEEIRYKFKDLPADRFYEGDLYNPEKFAEMNAQLNLNLEFTEELHAHKSGETIDDTLRRHKYMFVP